MTNHQTPEPHPQSPPSRQSTPGRPGSATAQQGPIGQPGGGIGQGSASGQQDGAIGQQGGAIGRGGATGRDGAIGRDGATGQQSAPGQPGGATGQQITVLLADDHAALRSGMRLMLERAPDIVVVGEASDGAVAVRQATALRPHVVLMDIRMPGTDGIIATQQITSAQLSEVLILTTFDLDDYVFNSLRAGAAGFLLKTVEADVLVDAVRRVAAGDGYLAPEVTRRLLNAFVAASPPSTAPSDAARRVAILTDRERDVLIALGRGLSNADLAAALTISEKTAKTHVSRVLAKLGCASRVQAAILAKEADMV